MLDAALDLLSVDGLDGFTLPKVAKSVGLAPPTLLQRFGSKQQLVERALLRSTERLERAVKAIPDTGIPQEDLVNWLVQLMAPIATRERVAGSLALLREDLVNPDRHALAQRHMRAIRRGIRTKLTHLGSKSPDAHARLVEAHWHGLVLQWALCGSGSLPEWMGRGLNRILALIVGVAGTATRRG